MQFFQQLGDDIDHAWRRAGYDERQFPAIAVAALHERPPAGAVAAYAPMEWALTTRQLPPQTILRAPFGQPAIQVHVTPDFYIEVLYWLDGTTAIHQHGFNGAFAVLAGSSLHATYRFAEHRRYGARLRLGELVPERVEVLETGALRPIASGQELTHALFHLDRPSVSVVVRTHQVAGADPQYAYLRSGLAYDPFHEPDFAHRQVEIVEALGRLDHPQLDAWLTRAMCQADPLTLVRLTLACMRHVRDRKRVEAMLTAAQAVHGELAERLILAVAALRREQRIFGLRSKLHHTEHRFLLALLLFFDHAAPMFDLVRTRHPGVPPETVIFEWLSQLSALPDPNAPDRKVFPFTFDGAIGEIARVALGGRSLEAVMAQLAEEFEPEDLAAQRDEIQTVYQSLRTLPVFGPLFR